MITDWIAGQLTPQAPGFWLLISLISGLGVLYLETTLAPHKWRMVWATHRLLIPYAGLLLGGLSPRLMGLLHIDWGAGIGIGLILLFAVTVLLILVRTAVDLPDVDEQSRRAPRMTAAPSTTAQTGGVFWQMLGQGIFLSGVREFHWAFLRGAIWEMLLMVPITPNLPGYWAVWLAAGIIMIDIILRRLIFAQTLFQFAILVCTSILFFYTRNFWLCWLLHSIAQVIVAPPTLRAALPSFQWGNRR